MATQKESVLASAIVPVDADKNEVVDVFKIKRIADSSSSHTNCATSLLLTLFTPEELKKDANINGKSQNGGPPKDKLNEEKVEVIKRYSLDRLPPGTNAENGWKECIAAIHKLQYEIRNGRLKGLKKDD